MLELTAPPTRRERLRGYGLELLAFTYKNAASCIFPVAIFVLLEITRVIDLPLARYDFLLLGCVSPQVLMLGLTMELFKTQMGSWSYPEDALSKVGTVPLYSGFMYASVASFICQAWRRFDLRLGRWPKAWLVVPLGAAIYLNFFTHHFTVDLRWALVALTFILFARTTVVFTTYRRDRTLPLTLAFVLIGLFVWLAENISTFLGAWTYPDQAGGWQLVEPSRIVATLAETGLTSKDTQRPAPPYLQLMLKQVPVPVKPVVAVVKISVAFVAVFGVSIAVSVYVNYCRRFVGDEFDYKGPPAYHLKPLDACPPHGAAELSVLLQLGLLAHGQT